MSIRGSGLIGLRRRGKKGKSKKVLDCMFHNIGHCEVYKNSQLEESHHLVEKSKV